MKRLEQIKALIRSRIGVIDVGTDHAFLPISLALAGYAGNLIASDIHPLPLQAAVKNAQIQGVRDRIVFRLSDGLDACHPEEVDTVILAGMGGDLICSILDRAEWTMDCEKQLLLQPMTKAEILRFWLYNNGYVIERECPVLENGRIFQIMSVRYMKCPFIQGAGIDGSKSSQKKSGRFAADRSLRRCTRVLSEYRPGTL